MSKLMKQVLAMVLTLTMVWSISAPVMAAEDIEDDNYQYALILKELGVFVGSDAGFELDRTPTRLEGLIMLIRLLGKEADAKASVEEIPFMDVPAWGTSYVGYAYAEGLTNGVSETEFGASQMMSADQYFTFMARALGYDDQAGDFVWNEAKEFLQEQGVMSYFDDTPYREVFTRSDLAKLSYDLLMSEVKGGEQFLYRKLIEEGSISLEKAEAIGIAAPGEFLETNFRASYGYIYSFKSLAVEEEILNNVVVTGIEEDSQFPASETFIDINIKDYSVLKFTAYRLEGDNVDYDWFQVIDENFDLIYDLEAPIDSFLDYEIPLDGIETDVITIGVSMAPGNGMVIYNIQGQ